MRISCNLALGSPPISIVAEAAISGTHRARYSGPFLAPARVRPLQVLVILTRSHNRLLSDIHGCDRTEIVVPGRVWVTIGGLGPPASARVVHGPWLRTPALDRGASIARFRSATASGKVPRQPSSSGQSRTLRLAASRTNCASMAPRGFGDAERWPLTCELQRPAGGRRPPPGEARAPCLSLTPAATSLRRRSLGTLPGGVGTSGIQAVPRSDGAGAGSGLPSALIRGLRRIRLSRVAPPIPRSLGIEPLRRDRGGALSALMAAVSPHRHP
jgi:hypothetical protein